MFRPSILALVLCAWLMGLFWAGRGIPFLADDYDFLRIAAAMHSPLEAFARDHAAPKPLHHLIFYWGAHVTGPSPALMRLPAFLAHAAALFFVHRLARQAGASSGGAMFAAGLYATFATTRSLLWPVAISGFARVTFTLAALSFWIDANDELRRRRRASGIAAVLAALLAMAAHQSGALTPLFLVLWSGLAGEGSLLAHARRLRAAALSPVVLASIAVVLGYLWWASGAPDQYRNVLQPGAIAANSLRGLVSLMPDHLRSVAVEAARGHLGAAGTAVGWATIAIAAGTYGWLLVFGGSIWRFAILAGAIDLGLAVVTAGYSQRYVFLAAALFSVAVGRSITRTAGTRRGRWLQIGALLLGIAWFAESLRIVNEFQDAGAVASTLLDQAERASARLPEGMTLVVANAPEVWGRDHDLMLFNWGFAPALEMRGVHREVRMIRTVAGHAGSCAAQLFPPEELGRLRADPACHVLEYDPDRQAFR